MDKVTVYGEDLEAEQSSGSVVGIDSWIVGMEIGNQQRRCIVA